MRLIKSSRLAFLRLILSLAIAVLPLTPIAVSSAQAAASQGTAEPGSDEAHAMKPPAKVKLRVGDACQRKTDNIKGRVKRDGCGRWFCGRADMKDIIELVPDIDKLTNCTWKLQGNRCLCQKNG